MTRTQTLLDEDLMRAAQILEDTARELKASNAVGDRQWVAPPEYAELMEKDRDDYDEMLRLAGVLRRHAIMDFTSGGGKV
jgi:hypothetical protein